MKTLIAGFDGDTNSAKILLDNIKDVNSIDILYLKNYKKVLQKSYKRGFGIFLFILELLLGLRNISLIIKNIKENKYGKYKNICMPNGRRIYKRNL